jgi:hypothetical protein
MNSPASSSPSGLAGIAIFLILRCGACWAPARASRRRRCPAPEAPSRRARPELEVIEGRPDRDIVDHVAEDSDAARRSAP